MSFFQYNQAPTLENVQQLRIKRYLNLWPEELAVVTKILEEAILEGHDSCIDLEIPCPSWDFSKQEIYLHILKVLGFESDDRMINEDIICFRLPDIYLPHGR